MKTLIRSLLTTVLALWTLSSGPTALATASPAASPTRLPAGLLNADGTLNAGSGFNGALSLQGWNVRLDSQRGPVFSPTSEGSTSIGAQAAAGQWEKLGAAGGNLSNAVAALAVDGSDVYIGGYFTNAAGLTAADYIVRWDGSNFSALSSNGAGTPNGSLNGYVDALLVSGGVLYVGGSFTNVNDGGVALSAADNLARWDGTHWSAVGSGTGGNGSLNGTVIALAISGQDLYVGGAFTDVDNAGTQLGSADYVAKWDGANWSSLGNNGGGNGSLGNYVYALLMDGTDVIVGGSFIDVRDGLNTLSNVDYIARWNGSHWSAVGAGPGGTTGALNAPVMALARMGSDIFAGGNFTDVYDGAVHVPEADYVAKWDGVHWSALGGNGSGAGSLNQRVTAFAVSGTDLYAGGYFTSLNNQGVPDATGAYVARWDGTTWHGLGSNGVGGGALGDSVWALAGSGGNLYVGGPFLDVNNNGVVISQADRVAVYGIPADSTPPLVNSIARADPEPNALTQVQFVITFSEPVTGVDVSDFVPTAGSLSGVSGSGTTYTATVARSQGDGPVRLDLVDDDSIVDAGLNPLGGVGAGNGGYTAGESYAPFYKVLLPALQRQ